MSLIPAWAPNVHPLIIHFPIVLIIAAVILDLVDAAFECPASLSATAASLYTVGAVTTAVAYFTGVRAGATVFIPGMAHPVLNDHRAWATYTAAYVVVVAALRLTARFAGFGRARSQRLILVSAGLIGVLLLQQTAERGARLVYEHGVGVIAPSGLR